MSSNPATTRQSLKRPRTVSDPVNASSADAILLECPKAEIHRPRFEYCALPHPDSIRLVKISSAPSQIECQISTVRLSESPSYEALSYCWGPPGSKVTIGCDGHVFYVSATLRDGLQQLHEYTKSSETIWLWIDQICIDQENALERTQQVRLMNKIYRQSTRTVIWLPLDEQSAIAATSVILELSRHYEAEIQLGTEHDGDGGAVTKANCNKSALSPPSIDDESWHALKLLFDLPWFERVWVIQEVTLSTRSPIVLCGTQLIPWLDIQQVAQAMAWRFMEVSYLPRAYHIGCIHAIGQRVVWGNGTDDITWDIQSLLLLTDYFLATNPRDRIFALLGLCKDTRHPEKWPVELNPEYDKPLSEVFTCVTKLCIRQTKTLNIFSIVDNTSAVRDKGFPSWVPRYDSPMKNRTGITPFNIIDNVHHRSIVERLNDASRGMKLLMDHTTQPGILRLRGMRLGSPILFCSTVWSREALSLENKTSKQFRQEIIGTLEACREHLSRRSTAELLREFFMVTTAGTTSEWEDAADEPLIHFKAYMGIHQEEASLSDTNDQMKSTHSTFGSHILAKPDADRYLWTTQCISGRRLFTIPSGLLGLGPDDMLASDVVIILFGGKVPYVLRPLDNGQWLFVGICYIYGLMKGEALQGDGSNEDKHEWFDLV
jgi:hypothetical protein